MARMTCTTESRTEYFRRVEAEHRAEAIRLVDVAIAHAAQGAPDRAGRQFERAIEAARLADLNAAMAVVADDYEACRALALARRPF